MCYLKDADGIKSYTMWQNLGIDISRNWESATLVF